MTSQRKPLRSKESLSPLRDSIRSQPLTHTTPLASSSILITLVGFTLAMVVLPLGTYFLTIDKVFTGNATAAGAVSALMANLVLVAYVYLAWKEDQAEQQRSSRPERSSIVSRSDKDDDDDDDIDDDAKSK